MKLFRFARGTQKWDRRAAGPLPAKINKLGDEWVAQQRGGGRLRGVRPGQATISKARGATEDHDCAGGGAGGLEGDTEPQKHRQQRGSAYVGNHLGSQPSEIADVGGPRGGFSYSRGGGG